MWWELCDGSSEFLVDLYGNGQATWQAAKKWFQDKGYHGNFLLIHKFKNSFKLYNINIKEKKNDK